MWQAVSPHCLDFTTPHQPDSPALQRSSEPPEPCMGALSSGPWLQGHGVGGGAIDPMSKSAEGSDFLCTKLVERIHAGRRCAQYACLRLWPVTYSDFDKQGLYPKERSRLSWSWDVTCRIPGFISSSFGISITRVCHLLAVRSAFQWPRDAVVFSLYQLKTAEHRQWRSSPRAHFTQI